MSREIHRGRHRLSWARPLLCFWLCSLATGIMAQGILPQGILPDERPGDRHLPSPPLENPTTPDLAPILPPFPIPADDEVGQLSADLRAEVREIRIEGNTVVSSEVLQEIADPFEGRRLSYTDLQTLRDELTLAYVERGYVTSGATLPDQTIGDGLLEVRIVEGKLEDIQIEVDGRFRPSYFRSRLSHSQRDVLDVPSLQAQLQLFQQDPQIESVQARLEPTATRGLSRLRLVVRETPFYTLGADFDNYRSPSIGSFGGSATAGLSNLIGVGDVYHARFTGSEGLRQAEAGFEVPFTVWDTRFGARYQYSKGNVVNDFKHLEIESESESVGFLLSQPLYRTLQSYIGVQLRADWRRAKTFVGGMSLNDSQESVLRFGLEAAYRSRTHSLNFRSLLSWGIDALGATVNSSDIPDGRFVSWLGQLQWASRLPWLGAQMLTRFDVQLSPDPLLSLEQYAIGGRYTVRGYRENTLVRDQGLNASVEVRIPVFEQVRPAVLVELAPFADIGRSWDNSRKNSLDNHGRTLASVGVGVRTLLLRRVFGELYWGHRLKDIQYLGGGDLQDDGVHFRLGLTWP